MITGSQIRAGRALAKLSAGELSKRAGVGISTVQRMEKADYEVPAASAPNLAAVQSALEAAGVEFLPENGSGPGVRLRKP